MLDHACGAGRPGSDERARVGADCRPRGRTTDLGADRQDELAADAPVTQPLERFRHPPHGSSPATCGSSFPSPARRARYRKSRPNGFLPKKSRRPAGASVKQRPAPREGSSSFGNTHRGSLSASAIVCATGQSWSKQTARPSPAGARDSREAVMSTTTRIERTEVTWNPTTGCDRISPGCDHCSVGSCRSQG
jgi:hypothetical protein